MEGPPSQSQEQAQKTEKDVHINANSQNASTSEKSGNILKQNYDDLQKKKKETREKYHKAKLNIISEKLKKNEPLKPHQKIELTSFLERYFDNDDLAEYSLMKKNYNTMMTGMTLASCLNVALVATSWKKFKTFKMWQKISVGLGVFLVSESIFTTKTLRDVDARSEYYIDKYKHVLNNVNFGDENTKIDI